eukprot:Rmarinus@m.599
MNDFRKLMSNAKELSAGLEVAEKEKAALKEELEALREERARERDTAVETEILRDGEINELKDTIHQLRSKGQTNDTSSPTSAPVQNTAEEVSTLRERVATLEERLAGMEILEENLEEMTKKFGQADAELKISHEVRNSAEASRASLEETLKETRAQLEEKIRRESELTETLDQIKRNSVALEQQLAEAEVAGKDQLSQGIARADTLASELDNLRKELEASNRKVFAAEEAMAAERQEKNAKISTLEATVSELEKQHAEEKDKIASLENDIASLSNDRSTSEDAKQEAHARVETLEADIEKLRAVVKEKEESCLASQNQCELMKTEIENALQQIQEDKRREDLARQEQSRLRTVVEDLQRESVIVREDLENKVREQQSALVSIEEEHKRVVCALKAEHEDATSTMKKARAEIESEWNREKNELLAKVKDVESLHQLLSKTETELGDCKVKAETLRKSSHEEISMLRKLLVEATTTLNEQCRSLRAPVTALRSVIDTEVVAVRELHSGIRRCVKRYDMLNTELLVRYEHEMKQRRALYNELQEIKGNIRVYCRVRPVKTGEEDATSVTPPDTLCVYDSRRMGIKPFTFDRVFGPQSTQEDVFEDTSPLLQSVIDGFNVCIFAYGQTGSGKTFTMQGPSENPGVNVRALTQLFTLAEEKKECTFSFVATYVELYNDSVRDLLASPDVWGKTSYDIKRAPGGSVYVTNLVQRSVATTEDVLLVVQQGAENRATACTDANEHSSRSHSILSISMTCSNAATSAQVFGKLHLIDLAGSERVSKTGATGDRLKEAQAINTSLSALGDVIQSLATKQAHVPYRNSKLTYLLQDSLGGGSKTLMFVQISPEKSNETETMSSLGFARKVKQVELGPAKTLPSSRPPSSPAAGGVNGCSGSPTLGTTSSPSPPSSSTSPPASAGLSSSGVRTGGLAPRPRGERDRDGSSAGLTGPRPALQRASSDPPGRLGAALGSSSFRSPSPASAGLARRSPSPGGRMALQNTPPSPSRKLSK